MDIIENGQRRVDEKNLQVLQTERNREQMVSGSKSLFVQDEIKRRSHKGPR